MPTCHCAGVQNSLCSEVNCPEVFVKKLEEGESGERCFFLPLFFFLTVSSEVPNSHDLKRKWGKAFSFE